MILSDSQLKELQSVATEILKVYIDVCKKLNVRYYITYGTLIGAVRHHGFIPWDDDIDVMMPRADYDKFLREAPALLPSNYFLQTPYNEKNAIFSHAKLRKSDTAYIEKRGLYTKMNHGLWIDVFVLDYSAISFWDRFKIKYFTKFNDYAVYDSQQSPETRKNYSLFRKLAVSFFKSIYPHTSKAKANNDKIYKSVGVANTLTNFNELKERRYPVDWFGKGIPVNFNGLTVNAPDKTHEFLTLIYGDYMQLPPVEQRSPLHEVEVYDMNKSYVEYIK